MEQAVWELIRASGLSALVLLTLSVAMGVSVHARALDMVIKRAWVYEVHQTISLLALGMMLFHLALVAAGTHVPISLAQSLVPFASPWRPAAIALGTASLYLASALALSSYLKPIIGHGTWRAIHYGGFLGWAAAMAHAATAGSDTDAVWVQYTYLASFALVLFLTAFRLLAPSRDSRPGPPRPAPDRPASGGRALPSAALVAQERPTTR